MGRMTEARRKARLAAGGKSPAPEPTQAAPEPRSRPPEPGSAPPQPAPRTLPSSGLAEDILRGVGRESAGAAVPVPTAGEPEVAEAPHEEVKPAGLSLSFFGAPVQEQREAAEATEHLACFFLEREEYGVDVRQVQEIRRVGEITGVPRAPDFVRGVVNLRGRILPVLDLKRKLGLGEVATHGSARIVVVRLRERLLGLLVDGASQVLKVPVSRIEPPPEEVLEKGADYIRGVAKLESRLIILVDLERLLAPELRSGESAEKISRGATGPDGIT
jgi:purine-binding chemotaxis protein CheW